MDNFRAASEAEAGSVVLESAQGPLTPNSQQHLRRLLPRDAREREVVALTPRRRVANLAVASSTSALTSPEPNARALAQRKRRERERLEQDARRSGYEGADVIRPTSRETHEQDDRLLPSPYTIQNRYQAVLISQLRQEAQQWKDQCLRLDESLRGEIKFWKDQFLRIDAERTQLLDQLQLCSSSSQHVPILAGDSSATSSATKYCASTNSSIARTDNLHSHTKALSFPRIVRHVQSVFKVPVKVEEDKDGEADRIDWQGSTTSTGGCGAAGENIAKRRRKSSAAGSHHQRRKRRKSVIVSPSDAEEKRSLVEGEGPPSEDDEDEEENEENDGGGEYLDKEELETVAAKR